MGSTTITENTTDSQKIELNPIPKKDNIYKGTYKEMYKVEIQYPKNFYDLIININTF